MNPGLWALPKCAILFYGNELNDEVLHARKIGRPAPDITACHGIARVPFSLIDFMSIITYYRKFKQKSSRVEKSVTAKPHFGNGFIRSRRF